MRRFLYLILVFLWPLHLLASVQDSLQKVLDHAANDKARAGIMDGFVGKNLSGDLPGGIESYTAKYLEISRKSGDPSFIAMAYFRFGQIYINQSRYNESIKAILRSTAIDDSMHDKKALIHDYYGLGTVLRLEKDYKRGFQYFRSGLALALLLNDTLHAVQGYYDIGQLFDIEGKLDSAAKYDLMTLDISQKAKNLVMANEAREELGSTYLDQGKYDLAIRYFAQTLDFYFSQNNGRMIGNVYNNLAYAYQKAGELDKAEKYGKLSMAEFRKIGLKDGLILIYGTLSDIYKAKGEYKEALEWSDNYIALHDSIYTENSNKQIAELDTKYQTAKKEEQIESQKAELDWRGLIIFTGAGVVALVVLFGGIIFFNYRKTKRLSHALAEQKQSLEELNGLKDKLFSIISHDLRGPLANTVALLELIGQQEISPEKLQTFSKSLSDSLQNNLQLLDNLLNWAASQIRGVKVNKKEISLQNLIDENIQAIKGAAEKKKVAISETRAADVQVYADLSMARLVLRNLLSNALKYTPEGGRITVESMVLQNNVRVSINDTGTGIEESLKNKLFSEQLAESLPGTNREKGFGIGLKLCKEFVEKNGGTLQVESTLGKGSIFSFTLPLAA